MTEPKFTDEDLKRLNQFLGSSNQQMAENFLPFDGSPFEKMKALLARLECAESLIRCRDPLNRRDRSEERAYNAWLRSKGEGGR